MPGQPLFDFLGWMFGDAFEDVSEPGLRVDVVRFCRADQCIYDGGPIATTVRASALRRVPHHGDPMEDNFMGLRCAVSLGQLATVAPISGPND